MWLTTRACTSVLSCHFRQMVTVDRIFQNWRICQKQLAATRMCGANVRLVSISTLTGIIDVAIWDYLMTLQCDYCSVYFGHLLIVDEHRPAWIDRPGLITISVLNMLHVTYCCSYLNVKFKSLKCYVVYIRQRQSYHSYVYTSKLCRRRWPLRPQWRPKEYGPSRELRIQFI